MKLTVFNGGLSAVLAKPLISTAEAVKCENVDLSVGALQGVAGPGTVHSIANARYSYWWQYKAKFIADPIKVQYTPYRDRLLKFDGASAKLIGPEETDENIIGIAKPTMAVPATEWSAGALTGTFQYCYTYYNSELNIESAPSPLTDELTVSGKSIGLGPFAYSNAATSIYLYRIGGAYSDFMRVAEITTESYIDDLPDSMITGPILATENNLPPPASITGVSERQGIFFGVVGTRVYYSLGLGEPWYWPSTNYIEFFEPLVATASVGQYTYVFAKSKVYLLLGDATILTKVLLSNEHGASTKESICLLSSTVLFCSLSAVCVLAGTDLRAISVGKLPATTFTVLSSAIHNSVYYAVLPDTTLAVNLQGATPRFSYLVGSWYDVYTDGTRLFTTGANVRKQMDGKPLPYKYKTGWLTDGELSNVKTYDKFYFFTDGPVEVKIYLDGILATTVMCQAGFTETTTPQSQRNAYYCELEFEGSGTLYEAAYTVMPRQT